MAIQFEGEVERRIRQAAARRGADIEATLLSLLAADESAGARRATRKRERDEALRREYEVAMEDPLFVEDMDAVMEGFRHADAETARMIDGD